MPYYTLKVVGTHPSETSFQTYHNGTAKDRFRETVTRIQNDPLLRGLLQCSDARLELWLDDRRLLSFSRGDLK